MVELCLEGGGKEGLEEGWKDDQAPLAQECLFALFNIVFFHLSTVVKNRVPIN